MADKLALFATAAGGTEDLLKRELETLGARSARQDRGGVRFHARLTDALRVCLWSRTAVRVLYPLGQFEARGAHGLYEAASDVEWETHLSASTTFAVDSTLKDSEHAHSGFVSLKIKDAIVDRLRAKLGRRPDVDTRDPDVRVVAYLHKHELWLSLDLCGEPLHRRGYRVKQTPAPLKETLAAAVLLGASYRGDQALCDPMCGSGTLLIEGAWIAQNRAPSLRRTFSVERWPHLGTQARAELKALREEAASLERPIEVPIIGYDRDPDALQAARRNVAAAGLAKHVRVLEGDATRLEAPAGAPGLIVTNPPYGDRLRAGGQKGMKSFYFKLGENLSRWAGWRAAVLSGNDAFESAFHARPRSKRTLWNGPLRCQLLTYAPFGSKPPR